MKKKNHKRKTKQMKERHQIFKRMQTFQQRKDVAKHQYTVSVTTWDDNKQLKVEEIHCKEEEIDEVINKIEKDRATVKVYNHEKHLVRQEEIDRKNKKRGRKKHDRDRDDDDYNDDNPY
jgi:flagellar hook assembly protein FlgD